MSRACPYSPAQLLLHQPPMLLLDRIIRYNDQELVAEVLITASSMFISSQGVPGHIALEYMAQACGAYVGAMALDAGLPVQIGLLIGTRECRIIKPWFRLNERLAITAAVALHDERLAAFDCKIEIGGVLADRAQLKVYQPGDGLLQLSQGKLKQCSAPSW